MTNEELVYLYQQGDKQALETLLEQNKGMVNKLVNKFYTEKTNSIDREDLMQEGFIGLIIASGKYDINNPNKAQFITYAIFWINQKIIRFVYQKNTNEETSLNISVDKDGDNELMDYIEGVDYSYENIEARIYIQQLHEELEQVMTDYNTLKEREILKMHYGWENSKCMTLEEIGAIFGVTRSMINSIENTACRKIRQSPWARNKAEELYGHRATEARYNISKTIEKINFAEKYL